MSRTKIPHLKDRGIGKTIANQVELVGRDIEMVAEQFDLALGIFPVVALREPNGLRTIDQSVTQIACRIVAGATSGCSTSGNRGHRVTIESLKIGVGLFVAPGAASPAMLFDYFQVLWHAHNNTREKHIAFVATHDR